jgi:uncharacterized small protein (DUF1192 family)
MLYQHEHILGIIYRIAQLTEEIERLKNDPNTDRKLLQAKQDEVKELASCLC